LVSPVQQKLISNCDNSGNRILFSTIVKSADMVVRRSLFLLLAAAGFGLVSGCGAKTKSTQSTAEDIVCEGIVYSVEYDLGNGHTEGFTRSNSASAVPGHNGSWNIDARGRLTQNYLIITRPQHPELGPLAIPRERLVNVQFGDGGIGKVDESKSGSQQ
jgi:hypothetical protein